MIVKDSFQLVPEETRSRQDVLITWILRVAVAVVFFSVGSSKFDARSMWVKLFDQIGFGRTADLSARNNVKEHRLKG